MSESNQPPNFLQRWKKVNFVCWLNTTFCVEKPYQKPRPSSININHSAPSYGMIQKWFTEFRCGRSSTETILSLGRPNEITTPEMINKIHHIVWNDPKVKVHEIAEIISIWTGRMVNILHTHLCMRKLCSIWVPRMLTIDKNPIRVTTWEQNLAYFKTRIFAIFCFFISVKERTQHKLLKSHVLTRFYRFCYEQCRRADE